MANSLGTAAHNLDVAISAVATSLATYLQAGGKASLAWPAVYQAVASKQGMLNIVATQNVKSTSPAQRGRKLVTSTPGAVYP